MDLQDQYLRTCSGKRKPISRRIAGQSDLHGGGGDGWINQIPDGRGGDGLTLLDSREEAVSREGDLSDRILLAYKLGPNCYNQGGLILTGYAVQGPVCPGNVDRLAPAV